MGVTMILLLTRRGPSPSRWTTSTRRALARSFVGDPGMDASFVRVARRAGMSAGMSLSTVIATIFATALPEDAWRHGP